MAGLLLGISNLISGLVGGPRVQREGYVPGEIVLETYDEGKMRSYLLEHGEHCSNRPNKHAESEDGTDTAENAVLLQFDRSIAEMKAAADDAKLQDALWNKANLNHSKTFRHAPWSSVMQLERFELAFGHAIGMVLECIWNELKFHL